MPDITLQFPYPINQSCQEGDILYYVPTNSALIGGFRTNIEGSDMIEMGPIRTITNVDNDGDSDFDVTNIVCDLGDDVIQPTSSDFMFFGKDRTTNEASIVGYYGEFTFKNNSKQKAELFTAACEITESSK
jgi:hypothetical protein